jgi:tetratricopeptide (TPR) repeat protein
LWAERYDEAIADIFELQGRISGRIVRTLAVRVTEIEEKLALAKSTDNLEAYDYVLRGRALMVQFKRNENFDARKLFRRAIELDRDYASAYAGLGSTYIFPVWYGWTESPQKAMRQAYDLAQQALSLERSNIDGHALLAWVYATRGQYELALVESERLIAINPNDARGFAAQGTALVRLGRPIGAILALETALRIDPNLNPTSIWHLGLAYYLEARYADAAVVVEENLGRRPEGPFDYLMLAATYGQMGREKEAARAVEAIRRLDPYLNSVNNILQDFLPADAARLGEGLRKAGLE